MDSPLISIIVPVYNKEKHLKRCLDSLVRQTYENFEIILVDDGSTDKSADLILEYTQKYSNIYAYYQKNQGASSARNFGMEKAEGEYICFVDGDDYIYEDYVSYLYEILQTANAECAICSAYKLKEGERYIRHKQEDFYFVFDQKEALSNFFYRKGITPYPVLKLICSDIAHSVQFPIGIKYGEDAFFVYQILKACKTVVYSPRILYLYYQNQESVTHQKNWKDYAYSWIFLKKEILEKAEVEYPEIRKSIQSKGFILATDFYCRVNHIKSAKEFSEMLKKYVQNVRFTVFMDSECKLSNRIIAGIACVSIKGMEMLCRIALKLNEKIPFMRKSL